MRPGQSCPGVVENLIERHLHRDRASMRPGQSCPGVVVVGIAATAVASAGFNEAGAIMPRSGFGRLSYARRLARLQ